MRKPFKWPRRNPYDKRWFQRQIAAHMTEERRKRVSAMITKWEPRLFEVGVNLPEVLLEEARYLERVVTDWRPFPMWVLRGLRLCEYNEKDNA